VQNHYPYPIQPLSPNALAQPGQFAPVDFSLEERDLFGRYWGVVRHHLWMILCLFVIAEVLTVLFLAGAPRLYTSSSTISIEPQTPEALPRETTRDD
jgi:uncharacterized protein involved in exopolysaccharide biosynthesis